jgi:hypothetical protein
LQPLYALPASDSFTTYFTHFPLQSQQRVHDYELLQHVRAIGNGTYPIYQAPGDGGVDVPQTDGEHTIKLPSNIFVPIPASKVDETALPWVHQSMYPEADADRVLPQCQYDVEARPAIVTTTNSAAAEFNDKLVDRLPHGPTREYVAWNEVLDPGVGHGFEGAASHAFGRKTEDACSNLEHSGIPRQHLQLRIVIPVHIMGNLDFAAGLCKGELAIVTSLGRRTITVKLLDPPDQAHDEFILSRINFDFKPTGLPVKIRRH